MFVVPQRRRRRYAVTKSIAVKRSIYPLKAATKKKFLCQTISICLAMFIRLLK